MSYPPPGQQPEQPEQPAQPQQPSGGGYHPPGQYAGGYPPPPGQQYGYPPPMYAASPPTNGKATTSLVLGIVSLVLCGVFTGVPAMILGRQAKREIAASQGQQGGEGLANAGFVTGLISTILSVLVLGIVIAVVAIGAAVDDDVQENCGGFDENGQFVQC